MGTAWELITTPDIQLDVTLFIRSQQWELASESRLVAVCVKTRQLNRPESTNAHVCFNI